jgi:hypothetical protein
MCSMARENKPEFVWPGNGQTNCGVVVVLSDPESGKTMHLNMSRFLACSWV